MKKLILFITAFLFCAKTYAQYPTAQTDAWLENNAAEMGGRVVLMIWHDGHIVYSHSVNDMKPGQKFFYRAAAHREGKTPDLADFTPTKREPIASCSKWLSAALVMTFVDEGKLKLTDTVGKYLPVLSGHGKGNITIADCLSHLTGIKPPSMLENYKEMKNISSMDEAIEQIAALPMEGKPGKTFHYSSVGLQIAAAVLEKISGKNFQALFAERIARPLDMKNTDFGDGPVAQPAGGGFSTTEDYMNFLVMILNKGVYNGKRILTEKSIAEMQVNRRTNDVKIVYSPKEAGDFGYGYGEWTMDAGSVSSPGLFGSFPWVDNNRKYCAFMMTYYLKNDGRNTRYLGLKNLIDSSIGKN